MNTVEQIFIYNYVNMSLFRFEKLGGFTIELHTVLNVSLYGKLHYLNIHRVFNESSEINIFNNYVRMLFYFIFFICEG